MSILIIAAFLLSVMFFKRYIDKKISRWERELRLQQDSDFNAMAQQTKKLIDKRIEEKMKG